ncbi:MAG: hypothetical protein IJV77_07950 [Clostridia bacterium]|nr:hypothetical protein [Clostridia bacterium]
MEKTTYLSSQQSYYNFDMGDAGVAKINFKTGFLSMVTPLVNMSGNNMPLNIELIYNSGVLNNYYMGNGVKLNVMQKMQLLADGNLLYTDAGECEHIFAKYNDGQQNFWVDQNGTGFTITLQNGNYVMHTGDGYQYVFGGGRLVQIQNRFGKTMSITYSGGKLSKVTDGIGRQAVLAYGTDGKLLSITVLKPNETTVPETGRYKVQFAYENGNLKTLTLPDRGVFNCFYATETDYIDDPTLDDNTITRYYLCKIETPFDRWFEMQHYAGKKIKTISSCIPPKGEQPKQTTNSIEFAYLNDHNTKVVNQKGVATTFLLNNQGKVYASFEGTIDNPVGEINYASGEHNTVQFNSAIPWDTNYVNGAEFTSVYDGPGAIYNVPNVADFRGKMVVLSGFANVLQTSATGSLSLTLWVNTSTGRDYYSTWFETDHSVAQFGATAAYVPQDCTGLTIWTDSSEVEAQFAKVRLTVANVSTSQTMIYRHSKYDVVEDVTIPPMSIPMSKVQSIRLVRQNSASVVQIDAKDCMPNDLYAMLSQKTWPKTLVFKKPGRVYANVTQIRLLLHSYNNVPLTGFDTEYCTITTSNKGVTYSRTQGIDTDAITKEQKQAYSTFVSKDEVFAQSKQSFYNTNNQLTNVVDDRGVVTEYTYDDHGNCTQVKTFDNTDPTRYFEQTQQFSADGDKLLSQTDQQGNATQYFYDDFGQPSGFADAKGNVTNYTVTPQNMLLQQMLHGNSFVNYVYTNGLLTSLNGNGTQYNFGYNGADINNVQIDGTQHLSAQKTYATSGDTTTVTFANGHVLATTLDKYGRAKQTKYNNVVKAENVYCDEGENGDPNNKKPKTHIDNYTNTNVNYTYDDYGDVSQIAETTSTDNVVTISVTKNSDRTIATKTTTLGEDYGNASLKNVYAYEQNQLQPRLTGEVVSLNNVTKANLVYNYDKFGRLTSKNTSLTMSFEYNNVGSKLTNQVKKVTYNDGTCDQYTYDCNGNITSIVSSNGTTTYAYDSLGRLVSEANPVFGTTSYSYDTNGNIRTKTKGGNVTNYLYTNPWKDQLTSVGGQAITYDAIGNPISYKGNALTWIRGRLLSSFGNNSYTYNSAGIRTSKTVGGVTTNYAVSGGTILSEITNGVTTIYYYSADGIIGFNRAGVDYFYRKNMQGDIIAIVNASGGVVAKYVYDAWGNHIAYYWNGNAFAEAISNTTNANCQIALFNPFRYRGYYFDNETGLYYLNSRYYDPQVGRFINADTIDYLDSSSVDGVNLYTYCYNNPIMYADPSGHWVETVFDILSLSASIVEVVINPLDVWAWAGLAGDALDLIPFVTGVGEGIKGYRVVAKSADLSDDALDAIRLGDRAKLAEYGLDIITFSRATDFTADALSNINKLDNLAESRRVLGINIHTGFMSNIPGKEFNKIVGIRPDYYNKLTHTLIELKPFNRNSLRRGVKHVLHYQDVIGFKCDKILQFYARKFYF